MITQLLDGKWTLTAVTVLDNVAGITAGDAFEMNIPGDVHDTLVKGNFIKDPYYGTNELDTLWIGKSDWTIERTFEYTKQLNRTYLCLEKVDTVADLFINDQKVASFDNEHQIHYLDVTDFLKEGTNTIRFDFTSSEDLAVERNAKLAYPIPCSRYPNDSANRNLVRKAQCNAGWDWGPCIMTVGIHESVRLVQAQDFLFESFNTTAVSAKDNWKLNIEVQIQSTVATTTKAHAVLSAKGRKFSKTAEIKLKKGNHVYKFTMEVPKDCVELWWPNGYGKQPLYTIKVTLGDSDKSTLSAKTAFRTIVIKNKPTMGGKEMTVCVNGKDIFAKGANWIPLDAIAGRMSAERYDKIISDAAWANMNMLRVWGGGWYEKEAFYDACDRHGIMLFHDMMFACSTYPADDWFLQSVEKELTDQIRKIKGHPCIALYCGNNEDLGALTWYDETKADLEKYYKDYEKLNTDTVGRVVMKEDPSRMFWPSSPCAGPGDRSDNWHSDGKGDMHFWSVWHEGKDFDEYQNIRPRFCSEFGYQSFPSLQEVKTFCPDDQLDLFSEVMLHHQKNLSGNQIITEHFYRLFLNQDENQSIEEQARKLAFPKMLYLSQIQQAQAIKTAITYWRSLTPYCMGTLYWQLNDVWPVSSWSSLEYSGRFKALHWDARRFYESVTPLVYIKDNKINLYAVNDGIESKKVNVLLMFYDYYGNGFDFFSYTETLKPANSKLLDQLDMAELDLDVDDTFCVAYMWVDDKELSYPIMLSKPKDACLEDPELELTVVRKYANGSMDLRISSKFPAFNVMVDSISTEGQFSDNNLLVLPEKPVKIRFIPKNAADADKVQFNLNDLYTATH